MFDAIRSLMHDLTDGGRYALDDKILTSSEDLSIEVEKVSLLWLCSEDRRISG